MIDTLLNDVSEKLGKENVIKLETIWNEGGIEVTKDNAKVPEHLQYLDKFCETFLDRVTSQINQGIDQRIAKIRQREW